MKRVINFRGKDILTGEWVFGDLEYNMSQDKARIHTYDENGAYSQQHVVPSDTVGQMTEERDGRGKVIYEDDIIYVPQTETNGEIIGVVKYERGCFIVKSKWGGWSSDLAWVCRERQNGEPKAKVIGNIHDNPEIINPNMMKGGSDV